MSPNGVRAGAAAVAMLSALFAAVLTGVATGVTGAGGTCVAGDASGPDAEACEPAAFAVLPAVAGLLGAAVAGGLAVGVTSALRSQRAVRTGRAPAAGAHPRIGPVPLGGDAGIGRERRPLVRERERHVLVQEQERRPLVQEREGHVLVQERERHALVQERERHALVQELVYLRDRLTSEALSGRLGRALADAGVATISPLGERFDPARHEAGGSTPAPDQGRVGRIAAVELPGYTDHGVVLRPPVVTVYR
ncbi:nucleotide exchange factor GrpE [Longispora sp. NPDC051575]|uniref:nucleotide exchange factor GrpE n=1 Tax=Longispora sp. NPDC051575 TaxID=3154943 RepID=UPI00341E802E